MPPDPPHTIYFVGPHFLYLPWAPPILSAALPECMRYTSYWTSLMPSDSKVEGIILEGGMSVTVEVLCIPTCKLSLNVNVKTALVLEEYCHLVCV